MSGDAVRHADVALYTAINIEHAHYMDKLLQLLQRALCTK